MKGSIFFFRFIAATIEVKSPPKQFASKEMNWAACNGKRVCRPNKGNLACRSTLFIFLLIPFSLWAQKKKAIPKPIVKEEMTRIVSYEVLENGDTINKLDNKNIKHGRWLIEHAARFDEEGTMEVGSFDNGLQTGLWRTYTDKGVLISEEKYKKGLKDGEARYYEEGRLICVGNYYALNAKYKYDTIMVEDPVTNEFNPVQIKTAMGSIRHGMWSFYEPQTKRLKRVVEYQADEVVYDKTYDMMSKEDSLYIQTKLKSLPHVSSKQDENIWHEKGKRGNIKYTDIPDDKPVKPNVRRK